MKTHTVILGGGPSGMACALALQQKKIPTIVIEKKQFPRDKTCGGLLTQKTVDAWTALVDPERLSAVFCETCDRVELWNNDTRMTDSALRYPLRSVKRREFDAFLAEEYRLAGGKLLENRKCSAIDPKQRLLTLEDGETVAYQELVAADGALSDTRTRLGYDRPPLAFCVETHIPRAALPAVTAPRIVFGLVRYGYAWVFPSGETVCVGLGGRDDRSQDYVALLKTLLGQLGVDPDAAVIRGAYVPYGHVLTQKRDPRNVLFVGDAGGFVDPLYGEGLYLAAVTGTLAAEAIREVPEDPLTAYRKKTAPYRKLIRQGVQFQKLFFSDPVQKRFLSGMKGRDKFAGFFCDNQLAYYGYSYARIPKLLSDYRSRS